MGQMRDYSEKHFRQLEEIFDLLKVGVVISDKNGKLILINEEMERTGGLTRRQLRGRNMRDLVAEGYVDESTILKVIETKKSQYIIEGLGDGHYVFVMGEPFFINGELELVVCTERNVTETVKLQEIVKEHRELVEKYQLRLEALRKNKGNHAPEMVAESSEMKLVIQQALRIAQKDITVLLTGESGTGKEVLARLIVKNSTRAEKPYIPINCAAIPENLMESEFFGYESGAFTGALKGGKTGIFEQADGGTLFLDEIGDMPLPMQAKFLRVLQEKEFRRLGGEKAVPVDVRIIAATNHKLEQAIEEGRFREDLYYRLSVFPIEIPALRHRREDIEKLAKMFLARCGEEYGLYRLLEDSAVEALKEYDWPGNVRELRNVIERTALDFEGTSIKRFQIIRKIAKNSAVDINFSPELSGTLKDIMDGYERAVILHFLKGCKNASEASRALGISKSAMSKKIKKHGILADD